MNILNNLTLGTFLSALIKSLTDGQIFKLLYLQIIQHFLHERILIEKGCGLISFI